MSFQRRAGARGAYTFNGVSPRSHASGLNTSSTGVEDCNTHMERDYENNTFVITATKDIKAGDELLHVYKGLGSRACRALRCDQRE